MRKGLRGFVAGVITMLLLLGTVAMASPVKQTIEVVLNSVNLTVNGEKVAADNILYEGRTYVQLREIAEMLGKEVGWDGETNTATINDKGTVAPTKEEPVDSATETLAQKNAVAKAKSYLDYTAFSKSGLVKQLEHEGFSNEDATYAVNKLDIDWREQAVKKANSYLDYTSFSRDGLIKQLEHEGFTNEEATYAVNEIGLQ